MKKRLKLKTVISLFTLMVLGVGAMAQENTMYVIKDGEAIFFQEVLAIDSVVFDAGISLSVVNDADNTFSDVRKLTFSKDALMMFFGKSKIPNAYYDLADIISLILKESTGIDNATLANDVDVKTYFNTEGNLVVTCSEEIILLKLFDIEANMLQSTRLTVVEAGYLPKGIYLLYVETQRGYVVKKVVKF